MQLQYNIVKMYLLRGVVWFMVAMPIIVLFFQEHNLTLTEIMLLQSIYSLSVAFFEIPSGYMADLIGRKYTIVMSAIFSFIGYLVFSFYDGFYVFAFAQILVGIGGSLMSGSDSALLYDTLLELKAKDSYTKIEGRSYAVGNFSEATAGILGGFLAVSSIYLPIYVQTGILFFSIPIAMSLVEPKNYRGVRIGRSSNTAILGVVRFAMLENKKIRWLIIYSSAMGVATLTMAWFAQPFFKEVNIPLAYFGILWAALNYSAGLTSFNAYRIRCSTNKLLFLISLLMFMSFVFLASSISLFGLIFIFIIYFLRGIVTPTLRNEININTPSDRRATILSIRSFIIRISFAITAPAIGYIAEHHSLSSSFYILAVFIGLFSFLSSYKVSRLD